LNPSESNYFSGRFIYNNTLGENVNLTNYFI